MFLSTVSGQLIIQVQKAIIDSPSEGFLERKWVIALLGSLSSSVVLLIVDWWRERKRKEKILHGLFREISLINETHRQNLPDLQRTLTDIQQGRKIGLAHAEQSFGENYKIYLNNFVFLGTKIDADIFLFYKYFDLISSASKRFDEISTRYMESNSDVRKENVAAMLRDIIDKTTKANDLGTSLVKRLRLYL